MYPIKNFGNKVNVNNKFYSSVTITNQALDFFKTYTGGSTVLEIGCGSGIYANSLRKKGIKVIATDACRINKDGLLEPNNRMAEFTNKRAINNIIEENAVSAVNKFGQNTNLSLFLSFPLPVLGFIDYEADEQPRQYDEIALSNFKGDKFFLIALYWGDKPANGNGNYLFRSACDATGSEGFHYYLYEKWKVIDKLLLETGRMGKGSCCYLIYFERKKTESNMSGGTNRKCPKNSAKDFKLKTVKKGLDGNLWIVSKRSDGVIFWKKK